MFMIKDFFDLVFILKIKIIIDSLNSLKNLDDRFLKKLKDKLYSFISIYEEKDLKKERLNFMLIEILPQAEEWGHISHGRP